MVTVNRGLYVALLAPSGELQVRIADGVVPELLTASGVVTRVGKLEQPATLVGALGTENAAAVLAIVPLVASAVKSLAVAVTDQPVDGTRASVTTVAPRSMLNVPPLAAATVEPAVALVGAAIEMTPPVTVNVMLLQVVSPTVHAASAGVATPTAAHNAAAAATTSPTRPRAPS
jgi:hypothetical protein